ncbi:hypothetical protein GGI21_004471, partial [Coemansia aciculifera]
MVELHLLSLPRAQPKLCAPVSSGGTKRRREDEDAESDIPQKKSLPLEVKQQEPLLKRRRASILRLSPTKPLSTPLQSASSAPASPSSASKKLKARSALQAIHIRALEHGLRVPICNTPLGVVSNAENIA